MSWIITFYNKQVEEQTFSLPKGILANLLRLLDIMEDTGPHLGVPYTKSIGEGLFEIRVKSLEGIGRSFFCTVKDNEIVILHSLVKKTPKIPKKDLKLAKKRMKEFK